VSPFIIHSFKCAIYLHNMGLASEETHACGLQLICREKCRISKMHFTLLSLIISIYIVVYKMEDS
jgi:hypothetical protein